MSNQFTCSYFFIWLKPKLHWIVGGKKEHINRDIFFLVLFQDAAGHTFATRMGYIFVIGKGSKPYISLPKGQGIKLTTAEERDKRLKIA